MPIFEFHQPRVPYSTDQDPSHWNFQMLREGLDGHPEEATPMDVIDEPFYFTCDEDAVRHQCETSLYSEWSSPLRQGGMLPEDLEACVHANLEECVSVLTGSLPYTHGWVQAQACQGEVSCTAWSIPLVVPSAPFDAMLFAGLIGLASLARFYKGPR